MTYYRKTTLGVCLTDSLEELKNNNVLSEELAEKVLAQFDKSFSDALSTRVKTKASFKGHLHTYRFCDNVWTFILENATFRTESDNLTVDKVKIVATDVKVAKPTEEHNLNDLDDQK